MAKTKSPISTPRYRAKREPSHRRGTAKASARAPQAGTLTLEILKDALEQGILLGGTPEECCANETAIDENREAAQAGDLWAVYAALERTYFDGYGWPGFGHEDRKDRRDGAVVPQWLHECLLRMIWQGINGEWPKKQGRHSTAASRMIDRRAHIARAYYVLRVRKDGVAWEDAYDEAADLAENERGSRVSPKSFERSYGLVAEAHRSGQLSGFLKRPFFPVPEDWNPQSD